MTDQQPAYYAAPQHPYPVYAVPASAKGMSIASFVLGLVSFFFGFFFVIPIVGLVLGASALKKEPAGRGFAIAGVWINAVMLGLVLLAIVAFVVLFALGLFASLSDLPRGYDGYSNA
jgi:hypothetical protein